ncbi:radical SAM protein [Caballeronia novacaledonica]|uniref:Radical SAM protein n=1 Tax=Caballeronia novacaledonica TaxID=1544861 RepID=A0AA37MT25_9BURK|nr:radical SAM protein [Caballeronia novacaledonica]
MKLVDFATRSGYATRIVTSGYFARDIEVARLRLLPLVEAGLKEIAVSWDDYHEEFVRFEDVKNLIYVAYTETALKICVNIVRGGNSRWTKARLARLLPNSQNIDIFESPLNMTGRASDRLKSTSVRKSCELGPCPYVIKSPTLSADGHLLACCGVIPNTERLRIVSDFRGESVQEQIGFAKKNLLFKWLSVQGPYSIIRWIGERYGLHVPDRSEIGGNCEACKRLFEGEDFQKFLDSALEEMSLPIQSELLQLESLVNAGLVKQMAEPETSVNA